MDPSFLPSDYLFEEFMHKALAVAILPLSLAACGGGGGGGSDPSAYSATTAGSGSTISTAEATGTIKYSQYQQNTTAMYDKSFSVSSVSATVNFNSTSKQGSIQFPVLGVNELVSTNDGYATVKWTGPFLTGAYKFNGDILMGCNTGAATEAEKTQVFVSSSLERVKDGFIDDLNGTTYDLFDCSILEQGKMETLQINTDGSLIMSTSNESIPKNQVFDMLNPEKNFGGALINGINVNSKYKGGYSGQVFKYGVNGVTRHAIVIQTNAGNTTGGPNFHYLLAVQR
ncbi:hypothetical protein [Noviherbaspirillum pedocola]|uniref:Uncharacterized protein n=1 Tax=Noviherbaspirillum pedocola TaxID=2801341 RepID=A0A934SWF9_9BURK|nr:hypothetical protein [Noviherbaspirillum pedocola]MBK4736625.1 hypothetical protein [Noviherbaspirillum pedocola]